MATRERGVRARVSGADLVGTREAAELFGVRPQNFVRDWALRPGFPRPLACLAATRVWSRGELERYRGRIRGAVRWPPRRRLSVSPETERWLAVMKRRIVRRVHPERIVLFGSQATGAAGPRSDVDLLLVMPEGDDRRVTLLATRIALADLPVSKDVFVTTPAEAARFGDVIGTVLEPALREGATIYART